MSSAVARQGKAGAAESPSSPEALASAQEGRRRQLVSDVDELAARLAPRHLSRLARETAQSAVAGLRGKADDVTAQVRSQVRNQVGFASGPASRQRDAKKRSAGHSDEITRIRPGGPMTPYQRTSRLFDDARDGDPAALGVITMATLALAGLSVAGAVKAVRLIRSARAAKAAESAAQSVARAVAGAATGATGKELS